MTTPTQAQAEWSQKVDEWNARKEELKKEILKYVNSKVNRFSRI